MKNLIHKGLNSIVFLFFTAFVGYKFEHGFDKLSIAYIVITSLFLALFNMLFYYLNIVEEKNVQIESLNGEIIETKKDLIHVTNNRNGLLEERKKYRKENDIMRKSLQTSNKINKLYVNHIYTLSKNLSYEEQNILYEMIKMELHTIKLIEGEDINE